jgi:hypothetical protein
VRRKGNFILPGGGPWKVLDECKSMYHNSLNATMTLGCKCPRGVDLYEKNKERMRTISRQRREFQRGEEPREMSTPRWFRTGPWRIAEECEAEQHNTLTAAQGGRRKAGDHKCICPRALLLLADFRSNRARTERAARAAILADGGIPEGRERVDKNALPSVRIPEPNWSRGACTGIDRDTAREKGFNLEVSKRGISDREEAKSLCQDCPLSMFRECGEWIKKQECDKPGILGGVYAGMDRWNRQGVQLALVDGTIKRIPYTPELDSADLN